MLSGYHPICKSLKQIEIIYKSIETEDPFVELVHFHSHPSLQFKATTQQNILEKYIKSFCFDANVKNAQTKRCNMQSS